MAIIPSLRTLTTSFSSAGSAPLVATRINWQAIARQSLLQLVTHASSESCAPVRITIWVSLIAFPTVVGSDRVARVNKLQTREWGGKWATEVVSR